MCQFSIDFLFIRLFKRRSTIGICVPPTLLSRASHHFSSVCLPLSHLLGSASPVCPSCACLTFDIHRFNKHQTFTECQRHPRPRLSPTGPNVTTLTLTCLCMRICMPNIQVCMYSMNKGLCRCGQVRVCVHASFTYIRWPLCSSPGATSPACHSHTGFTSSTPHPPSPSAVTHMPD